MKFITAILFVLLGFQLFWLKDYLISNQIKGIKTYITILSVSVLIVIFSMFIHLNSNLFEGLIDLFSMNRKYDPWTTIPHIPSILTCLSFFVISFSQFAVVLYRDSANKILCFTYVTLFIVSGLVISGYLTDISWLFRITIFGGGVAIHSSMLFILCGLYLWYLRSNKYK